MTITCADCPTGSRDQVVEGLLTRLPCLHVARVHLARNPASGTLCAETVGDMKTPWTSCHWPGLALNLPALWSCVPYSLFH